MIVGMVGKKRSGKDSFAATLVEHGFERRAFADPLRAAVLGLDPLIRFEQDETRFALPTFSEGCPIERLSSVVERLGWETAKEIREVRRSLQNYGVAIREIDPDFWIRTTVSSMRPGTDYVVTDVRFPNEVHAIRNFGGVIVKVIRPGQIHDDSHVSETALDDLEPDFFATNDGTLEDLAAQAKQLLRVT